MFDNGFVISTGDLSGEILPFGNQHAYDGEEGSVPLIIVNETTPGSCKHGVQEIIVATGRIEGNVPFSVVIPQLVGVDFPEFVLKCLVMGV